MKQFQTRIIVCLLPVLVAAGFVGHAAAHEQVVPRAAVEQVGAVAAKQHVVAAFAIQLIILVAAAQQIVAA